MNNPSLLKLEVQIAPGDISRSALLSQLDRGSKLNLRNLKWQINNFIDRISSPFEIYWYRFPVLSLEDQRIVAVIAEMYGADRLIVQVSYQIEIVGQLLRYVQRITFLPWEGRETGRVHPEIFLEVFGIKRQLTTIAQVFMVRLILLLGFALLYAIFLGVLLYGLAVGLLFQELPAETLALATKQPLIGLALLCFLMGIAGVLGRAVRFVLKSAI